SLSEILCRSRPDRSVQVLDVVAHRGKTNDERELLRATGTQVVDPSKAKPNRNSPGPCARPDDRRCERDLCRQSTDSRCDNHDDTTRADTPQVRPQCSSVQLSTRPLRRAVILRDEDCRSNAQKRNSIPKQAWLR